MEKVQNNPEQLSKLLKKIQDKLKTQKVPFWEGEPTEFTTDFKKGKCICGCKKIAGYGQIQQ